MSYKMIFFFMNVSQVIALFFFYILMIDILYPIKYLDLSMKVRTNTIMMNGKKRKFLLDKRRMKPSGSRQWIVNPPCVSSILVVRPSHHFKFKKKKFDFQYFNLRRWKIKLSLYYFPFPTSSKRRKTRGVVDFFSTNYVSPFLAYMGMIYRVHNYSSYYRVLTYPTFWSHSVQNFWFAPTLPTCPTVAKKSLNIRRIFPDDNLNVTDLPSSTISFTTVHAALANCPTFRVWFLCYLWYCLTTYELKLILLFY